VVQYICDEIVVMYLGRIVEKTNRRMLFQQPLHPYTRALLSAVPLRNPSEKKLIPRIRLAGDLPNPMHPPAGCRFWTRCQYAQGVCKSEEPKLNELFTGHWAACHLATPEGFEAEEKATGKPFN